MTEVKIKRSLIKSFLNTNTVVSPTWSLIGSGVVSGKINYNPNVTAETYIHEDNASKMVESYEPEMPIEMTALNGSAVFEWIDAKRKARSILDDVETEIVNVWLYETVALTYYYAEKQNVNLSIEDFGGDGGTAAKINYTINYLGDPVRGEFSPTALAFVARPVDTELTTMVIGSVTLAPLFATDKSRLHYAGSVSTGTTTVAMTSTLVGATIVQYDGVAEVAQAGTASLDVGVNHLYIHSTVGSEEVIYCIDITRAAS